MTQRLAKVLAATIAAAASVVAILSFLGFFSHSASDPIAVAIGNGGNSGTAQVTITQHSATQSKDDFTGHGVVNLATGQAYLTVTSLAGTIISFYFDSPLLYWRSRFPSPTPWLIETPKQVLPNDPGSAGLISSFDFGPAAAWTTDLSALLENLTHVQRVGRETLYGVTTTHVKGIVNVERVVRERRIKRGDADMITAVAAAFFFRLQTGSPNVPVEVWIDREGFVRRILDRSIIWRGHRAVRTYDLTDFGAALIPTPIEHAHPIRIPHQPATKRHP